MTHPAELAPCEQWSNTTDCRNRRQKEHTQTEPAHDKTYNKTCTTSEDLDQPVHPRSLIRIFANRMCLLQPPGKREPCHTGWMYRLNWVDAGLIVAFVVRWLKFNRNGYTSSEINSSVPSHCGPLFMNGSKYVVCNICLQGCSKERNYFTHTWEKSRKSSLSLSK